MSEREVMEFDVVIVGAGVAGLSAAIRLKQLNSELSVCVLEKGSEVGAHILSGAVFETKALDELIPDWQNLDSPVKVSVSKENVHFLFTEKIGFKVPNIFVPKPMHNDGNYIISLASLCRWLAQYAENMAIDIFPGFAASSIIYGENDEILGVITGDMGVDKSGNPKESFTAGMELRAKYTIFAEGSRGHLGKELLSKFKLEQNPQHYGIGIKEIWEVPAAQHQAGLVVHTAGWPLGLTTTGGGFLYHDENHQVALGLIVDLSYRNPHLSPFDEFQRFKHHPTIKQYLAGGTRISYGARALTKGGFNSLPKFKLAGGIIVGCDFGTLNGAKIKGIHTAMKSAMLAAEAICQAIKDNRANDNLPEYEQLFKNSWLYQELYESRNFGAAIHKFGTLLGAAFCFVEHNLCRGKLPITLQDNHPDHLLHNADACKRIDYPKPDGVISFDKTSSVFLANINHEEDQPCHLLLEDAQIPIQKNLPQFAEPAQRYCPAGVYEVIELDGKKQLQINAANCVHCKTCDIKDPAQNITWITPEGGSGPNYANM